MTWLLAPSLNHLLSYRTALISQYETGGQPFDLLFRIGDMVAGGAVIWMAVLYRRHYSKGIDSIFLFVMGAGMLLDPVFTTTCHVQAQICQEETSFKFILHATETVLTAFSAFALVAYDAYKRHQLVSYVMLAYQVFYGVLFLTQYASHQHFNTISQYLYQCSLIVWLAWYCGDVFYTKPNLQNYIGATAIRYTAAIWAFLNGLLAVAISLAHIHVVGRIEGLYFGNDGAWLAQHGVIVGVVMLYLSRHLMRGEMRARQIFLLLVAIEAFKYAVITPNVVLLLIYAVTFCLLFVARDEFARGSLPLTWRIRLKDLAYMVIAILIASLLSLLIIDRDDRASVIARHTFNHLTEYALHSDRVHPSHRRSALLGDTATAFIAVSAAALLWILFRPTNLGHTEDSDFEKVRLSLLRYSNSSEDYFKLWPPDKNYYWDVHDKGFVAYKVVSSVAFALADPMTGSGNRKQLTAEFIQWCRSRGLRACFLPVSQGSLAYYDDLNKLNIGSSAIIDIDNFIAETSTNKWWRWKRNRADKQGYQYATSQAPHDPVFLQALKAISDAWLAHGGHQERGFALGYFDEGYLNDCTIHYLTDSTGKIVAFTNQLPVFKSAKMQTIDLLRFLPDAKDSMPYLIFNLLHNLQSHGFKQFDLGFVPFASSKNPIISVAKILSAGRFSAKGLEQFKNKFEPDWQPQYLVYDGDLGDLAVIAINLEKALNLEL